MPTYKVTAPGFMFGRKYGRGTTRHTLNVDKPFKKDEMPSWVDPEPIDGKTDKPAKSTKPKGKPAKPPTPPKAVDESTGNPESDTDQGVETL